MSQRLRRLAVAVATGRIAAVFFENQTLIGWAMSRHAYRNPETAAAVVGGWIDGFVPDHLIMENPSQARRKGTQTQAILATIATVFAKADGLDIQLARQQQYPNKYLEAAALAKRYPVIAALCPSQPPIWLPEPRSMSYFEALALADQAATYSLFV